MKQQREHRIKETLIRLIELFRDDGEILSESTEEQVVRAFEELRWDLRGRIPESPIWEEVDEHLRGMNRTQKRRFECLVREMLLSNLPPSRVPT